MMVKEVEQAEEIRLPEMPGVRYRKFRGEADYARMVTIVNAVHVADGVEEVLSVAEMANEYDHLENCDPQTDLIFIEVQGELVAYGGIQWRDDDEGNRLYEQTAFVHPDWRSMGLQRVLYGFNEARAGQLAATHPAEKTKWMSKWLPGSDVAEQALLQSLSYTPVRHFFTMHHNLNPIPCAKLPAGIELRPVQTEQLRAIWNAKEEAFADHWGHGVRTEEDFRGWCENPMHERHLWQVAWDVSAGSGTGEVAGVSINTIYYNDNAHYGFKRGWIETLGVRRNWRGQGLAKALLANSLRKLHVQGMTEAALGVDAANPTGALQLYEGMGFYRYQESAVWRKKLL